MSVKITEIWAFVVTPPGGDEQLLAAESGLVWLPMICTDKSKVELLKVMVDNLVQPTSPYELRRFTLETPSTNGNGKHHA